MLFLTDKHGHPHLHLALLLVASVAIVATLLVVLMDGHIEGTLAAGPRLTLLTGLVVALSTLVMAFLSRPHENAVTGTRHAQEEIAALRRELLASAAIVGAEHQVLIYWEQGQRARLLAHTLNTVPGLPAEAAEIERFGAWLTPQSADELKQVLDRLFGDGRSFDVLLKTRAGGHVEADGRAAGGRAVLRLRDVVGYRRDLARIIDQHRQLKRDIGAQRTLLDALPMPVWIRNGRGELSWVNEAYLKAIEARSLEEVRSGQIELLEGRDAQRFKGLAGAKTVVREHLPIIVHGERKSHEVIMLGVEDGSVGAAIDTAEIEHVRDNLERQIAAYDRTLHRVSSGIAVFGPDNRLVFFNEAFRNIWRLESEWLASHPSDGEWLDRLRQASQLPQVIKYRDWRANFLARSRSEAGYEDWWHLIDGRTIHVAVEQRPDGGVTYLVDDVTQRLALESRYNALIAVQGETIDAIKDAVAVFDPDGSLKLSNAAFAAIWRLGKARLAEGMHIDVVIEECARLHDDPAMWQSLQRQITGIAERRQTTTGQLERNDGVFLHYAAVPLPDGATMITFSDVTDAKSYERALIEKNEALLAADRLKSQFIGHISYELRSPLTNIIGFAELLQSPRIGSLNDKQREYLGDLTASSKTLLAIIDDILDLATIDAGGLELKLSPMAIRPAIDAALLGVRERASRLGVNLQVDVQSPDVALAADEARIRQIVFNLASNAIGFSKAGDTVQVRSWRASGSRYIAIEDQGVGIPKEEQAKVFERFESSSKGGKHRGAGLGLAIVKSLVDLHGGEVRLDSTPGIGTSVIVRLPERERPLPVIETLAGARPVQRRKGRRRTAKAS